MTDSDDLRQFMTIYVNFAFALISRIKLVLLRQLHHPSVKALVHSPLLLEHERMISYDDSKAMEWSHNPSLVSSVENGHGPMRPGLEGRLYHVVLDSNTIVSDAARTLKDTSGVLLLLTLQEFGFVKCHIPQALVKELRSRTVPKFAARRGLDEVKLRNAVDQYLSHLIIHAEHDGTREGMLPRSDIRDVDDWPAADLLDDIDADFILSNDKDFKPLGTKWMTADLFRAQMVEFANRAQHQSELKVGINGATLFSAVGIGEGSKALWTSYRKLPPNLQWTIGLMGAGAAGYALCQPRFRRAAVNRGRQYASKLGSFVVATLEEWEANEAALKTAVPVSAMGKSCE